MRKLAISSITLGIALLIFVSSPVMKTRAENGELVLQAPGTRCTRLTFGPAPKKPKKPIKSETSTAAMPGTRCLRLSSGGREGTILPNTAPNVGLAASSAYIATNADSTINLNAIACDIDSDSLLYTYSTTGGRIQGDGANAVWNLSDATRPGTYTVTVEVDDGCGCLGFASSVVRLE